MEHGLYFTTCAPAAWYGSGVHGLFIALFIYSKVAELMDTVLLLLAGKPVIALQWWHHSTELLYCWHSYSVRIATGSWFACMNYSVHSDVRLLRYHGDSLPQGRDAVRHLHHFV